MEEDLCKFYLSVVVTLDVKNISTSKDEKVVLMIYGIWRFGKPNMPREESQYDLQPKS
jgi:hypothetical protein